MNTLESFNKTKEEYEKGLSSFGTAMLLVDKENNIIFLSQEAKSLLSDDNNSNLLIGKKFTSVIKATTFNKAGGDLIDENIRPSSEATMIAETRTQIYYISPINSPEKILVSTTATPLLLSGQVAGAIIIIKKI